MKGKTFVDMFRLHWNSSVGQYHQDYFDSIERFQIVYVFRKIQCIPEYCTREQLQYVIDKILHKSICLYLRSVELGQRSGFNISFSTCCESAEITISAGDADIFVYVWPEKSEERYDRQR